MKIASIIKIVAPIAALLVLTGCAGMRVGPGTTTGLIGGTIIGAANGNAGKGAIIGGSAGAVLDILSGQPPVEVEPVYRDGRRYDPRFDPRYDRRYDPRFDPRYDRRYDPRFDPRYDRRPIPAPVYDPRYDRNCGCYR